MNFLLKTGKFDILRVSVQIVTNLIKRPAKPAGKATPAGQAWRATPTGQAGQQALVAGKPSQQETQGQRARHGDRLCYPEFTSVAGRDRAGLVPNKSTPSGEVGAWGHVLALELPQLSMSGDSIQ